MANNKGRFGLILPKKQEKQTAPKFSNVFGDDNASDDEDGTDWVRKALKAEGEKNKIKKQTKLNMQKALTEDPTIYQYDEVYDDMERNKSELDKVKQQEKKPRYIQNLLKAAERRKKEQEHRIERMVQKEREAEGEMYADKESFVTSAYKAKLEEFKKMEEDEAKMDRLEAIADVTKQQDMSGFYRHLYKQTIDYQDQTNDRENNKIKNTDVEQKESTSLTSDTATTEAKIDAVTNKTMDTAITDDGLKANIKSKKSRQYRQRMIETYESESESENEISKEEQKKEETVLSLNKNTEEIETQEPDKKKQKKDINLVINKDVEDINNESSSVNDNEISQDCKKITSEIEKPVIKETVIKKDRSSIWQKRTVGPVFEAALQRYYARKAARLVAV